MNNINIYPDKCKIKSSIPKVILEVEYDYSYEPEVHTYRNGDPGHPEFEEVIVNSIWCSGDLHDLLCNYTTTKEIIDEIEEKICNYERRD